MPTTVHGRIISKWFSQVVMALPNRTSRKEGKKAIPIYWTPMVWLRVECSAELKQASISKPRLEV